MSTILNIFRLGGDIMHLVSILMLLLKIDKTRSCAGLSFKAQLLFGIVYASRYMDLFNFKHFDFLHFYNFFMKCFFLGTQAYVLYCMWVKFRATYDKTLDSFPYLYLIAGSAVLAIVFMNYHMAHGIFSFLKEYLWTFSIFLESVAILPQMHQLSRTGEAETITTHYLFCLGAYRGLYILNWIYRAIFHHAPEAVVVLPGIVQTALYSDFFYVYYTRVMKGKRFKLPV